MRLSLLPVGYSHHRQRIGNGQLFEKLDDIAVARQLADRVVLLFRHERRWVEAAKFLELTIKVRIVQRCESARENLTRSRNDDLVVMAQGRKVSGIESENRQNLRQFCACADHGVVGAPAGHVVFSSGKQQSLV
jgi:hypothetical protein